MDGDDRSFRDGIEAVQQMKKDNGDIEVVEAITSVPCFEFWLWLHEGKNTALSNHGKAVSDAEERHKKA